MIIEMSLLLYILIGSIVGAALVILQRMTISKDLDHDDFFEFCFDGALTIFALFLGYVWPITVSIAVAGAVFIGIAYGIWRLTHDA